MNSHFPSDQSNRRVVARSQSSDFFLVLSRLIELTGNDPAQLRALVYEVAREKLRHETWRMAMSSVEAREHLSALEDAIGRMEELTSREMTQTITFQDSSPPMFLRKLPADAVEIFKPVPNTPRTEDILAAVSELARQLPKAHQGWWPTGSHAWQLAGFAILGVIIYFGFAGQFVPNQHTPVRKDQVPIVNEILVESKPSVSSGVPVIPLPATFGVYAISQGALYQLEPLPIRIPDKRVLIGPVFTKPSQVMLPDGKVSFVIFRRDLVNAAPEQVAIRVVARIARELKFQGGQALLNSEASWAIAGKSYELPVAPLGEDQQMILIKSESEDFFLPSGRYALAFNGTAYDFTVDGKISDPAQCLERIEGANAVYTACPNR
jgi:hypothetical protein